LSVVGEATETVIGCGAAMILVRDHRSRLVAATVDARFLCGAPYGCAALTRIGQPCLHPAWRQVPWRDESLALCVQHARAAQRRPLELWTTTLISFRQAHPTAPHARQHGPVTG